LVTIPGNRPQIPFDVSIHRVFGWQRLVVAVCCWQPDDRVASDFGPKAGTKQRNSVV